MLVSLTRAELMVVGYTQMLGKSSSMSETAYTIIRQKDTAQRVLPWVSEAEAQKNMQLLHK